MAVNSPAGDRRRVGTVRRRSQVFNPVNKRWTIWMTIPALEAPIALSVPISLARCRTTRSMVKNTTMSINASASEVTIRATL